jgi:hypothetical protein
MLRRCVLQLVEDDMSAPRRGARAARRGTVTLATLSSPPSMALVGLPRRRTPFAAPPPLGASRTSTAKGNDSGITGRGTGQQAMCPLVCSHSAVFYGCISL